MSIDVNVQNDLVIVTETTEDIVVNVSNAAGPAGPAGANGVGVPVGGTTGQVLKKFTNTNYDTYWAADASGLTSVGLSMPSAFAVSNSPLTSNGTLSVTGAGTSAQYVRGDGQLANFPTSGGGGSSVNYYLNGSVSQGTFGGDTYYEMSKTPIIGAGTNFTRTNAQGNGYIASFITDAGDPALLNIPGGNWNLEFYFQASSSGSTPSFYAELYKVSSSNVFTLITSGSTNPEGITQGTVVDQYFTSIPVPQTTLLATDRIAIRIFVTPSGRTITLHTENSNLCEVLTTFSTGLNALNGLTAQVQYFATGTSGTDFAISSATDTHTFNLPTASATNRGALSSADWSTFNGKVGGSGATGQVAYWNGTNSQTGSNNLFWDAANARLGIGTNAPTEKLQIVGGFTASANSFISAGNLSIFTTNTPRRLNLQVANGSKAAAIGIEAGGTIHSVIGADTSGTDYLQVASRAGIAFYSGSTIGNIVTDPTNERMRLTTLGRLLLGTTTESTYLLDVNGTARVSGASTFARITATTSGIELDYNSGILYHAGGSGSYYQYIDGVSYTFRSRTATGSLIFATQDIERMRLTSGGNLLVGTTTDNGNRFQVSGAGSFTNIITLNTSAADTVSLIVNGNTGSGVRQRFINQASSGFYNWQIGTSISAVNQFEILPSTAIDGTTFTTPVFKISTAGAATFSSSVTATSFIKSGGTSSQYLMADGSVTTGGALTITNRQTASYTLVLTDADKLVEMNVATANNLTVPINSSVAFPIGTKIDLAQYGAGQTTVVATSGVTVRSAGGALKIVGQYSAATLVKIATDEWYLIGNITT